jgi:ABC-type lipoprotein release transport system permease subunit
MRRFLEVARTGLDALLLHPLRSLVTTTALVAVLTPYLAGLGLARGIQDDAEASVRFGADLYLTGNQFGRSVPIPVTAVADVRNLEGVTEVVPRIVGEVMLGKNQEHAVLVGLPAEHFPAAARCVVGRLPSGTGRNEFVVGSELARRLGLHVGSFIPPFYRNDRGERVSEVVGLFEADVSLWQANLILTTFDAAASIFNQEGLATDLLVSCSPGHEDRVSRVMLQRLSWPGPGGQGTVRPRVTAREDLLSVLPTGPLQREGVFTLHFLLAFAVGILVVLVTSGAGLSERRREVGILKAIGWQTDEVLLRALAESFLLSLAGAALALVLAWVWLRCFNGYGVARLFLPGLEAAPLFRIPARLTPVPALLAFVLSFVIVMSGTLYSSWRAAIAPPREALR